MPEPLRGRFTVHVRIAYLGPAAEGQRLVAGLRAAGPTPIDTVAEMPFTAMASIHADPVDPAQARSPALPVGEEGHFVLFWAVPRLPICPCAVGPVSIMARPG